MPEDIITPSAEPAPVAEVALEDVVEAVFGKDSPPEASAAKGARTAGHEPVSTSTSAAGAPGDEPVTERVTAKIAAGLRAERRAADARRERNAFEASKVQASRELDAQRAAVAADLKLVEQLKAAKASPSEALRLLGLDGKTFLTTLANENEPHAIAARAVSVEQTEREKLAAEVASLKKSLADREAGEVNARITHDGVVAQRAFLDHVATKADEYPNTVEEFTPREIVERGWKLAEQYSKPYFEKYGEYPSDEVIAEQLEKEAAARAQQRTDSAWRERVGKTAPKPKLGTPTGDSRASQPERGPSPRTLSSRQTSERGSAPRPWTQEAADEESMRILNGAIK